MFQQKAWAGGGILRLQADPPARELEKFFTLGTEIPAYAGMISLRAGVRPACAKASAKASGQVLLLETVVRSQEPVVRGQGTGIGD
jgi:hypothetical protein